MDGVAQWTEIGDQRGLDHLAMLRPIEVCYQGLLPGLSSVTTRLRYYSFHCWWLDRYARGGVRYTSDDFLLHIRRCEFLYALASTNDPSSPGALTDETGLSGRQKASKKIAVRISEDIDFRVETDRDTPQDDRYLAPLRGDFSGIYAPQMIEIGLLGRGREHGQPVPTEFGRALGRAFAESVGPAGQIFEDAATCGVISRSDLNILACFRPGAINPESEEAALLSDLLFARVNEGSLHSARRDTLRGILDQAAGLERSEKGVSQESLRWHWMDTAPDPDSLRWESHSRWQHYQAGDTTRVCYEALLSAVTLRLSRHPGGAPLPLITQEITASLEGQGALGAWLDALQEARAGEPLRELQSDMLEEDTNLATILTPVARLRHIWSGRTADLSLSYPAGTSAQTCHSELQWLETHAHLPARDALAKLIKDRVIRRHLLVAAKKFRQQKSYTYVIEVEGARLQARRMLDVVPSGPRLKTAIQFLADLGLLVDGHLTGAGAKELEGA